MKTGLSKTCWTALVLLSLCGGTAAFAEEGPESGMAHDWTSRMHFHGYGELHYNQPDNDNNQTDLHRFVLGWGYQWSDSVRFDGEVDFEHNASELELEYAMLEFDVAPSLSVRAGTLLMPVGPLNEFHEPPLFYSVERPYLEKSLIPTTWQENGVGVAGRGLEGQLAYRAYLVTGLDAGGFGKKASGFTTMDGLRKGRSKGVKSVANDLAFVGRLEYRQMTGGLSLGGTVYVGEADQENPAIGADVRVSLFELDVRYRFGRDGLPIDLKGEFVRIDIGNADAVNIALPGENIGSAMQGWNLEVGFHLLPKAAITDPSLVLFVRREQFDTNHEVPSGLVKDPTADRGVWTAGLAYYPDDKVAVKADVESWKDGTGSTFTRFNLGFGFMF